MWHDRQILEAAKICLLLLSIWLWIFFPVTRRVRKMRHHLKKQHECSYLLLFSFQSNNLFSSGEIFTAANVSLLCHVFVIHRGRLPRSIGLRIPTPRRKLFRVLRVYSSIGRKMRVCLVAKTMYSLHSKFVWRPISFPLPRFLRPFL